MKKYEKFILYAVLFYGLTTNVLAQKVIGGRPGMLFRYGGSARAMALGGAFCAAVKDGGAIFSNPAGLATINKYYFLGLYSDLYFDTRFGAYAGSFRYQSISFGLAFLHLSTRNFIERDRNGFGDAIFSFNNSGIIAACAWQAFTKSNWEINIGANVYLAWKDFNNINAPFDNGINCESINFGGLATYSLNALNDINFGIKYNNIAHLLSWESTATSGLHVGLMYATCLSDGKLSCFLDYCNEKYKESNLELLCFGFEASIIVKKYTFSGRIGLNQSISNQLNPKICFGVSIGMLIDKNTISQLEYVTQTNNELVLGSNSNYSISFQQ